MSETANRSNQSAGIAAPAGGPPGGLTEREFTVKERSQVSMVLTRFLRHRLAMGSLIVLLIMIASVYLLPMMFNLSYTDFNNPGSLPPSFKYLMGTDELGHNYFALVVRGAQHSINIALLVAVVSSGIGAPYGAISGYYGGKVDAVMMRFVDVILTLPFVVVVAALAQHFAGTWYTLALLLGVTGWVINARVTRGVVLSVRNQEFVEAARALGASDMRIIFRHLIPNVTGTLIVQATLDIAGAILAEAGLSFIGLGIHDPDTSLGALAFRAKGALTTRPWLFYWPGIVIVVICLAINFVGDGLRDALDPRQTRQRR